MNTSDLTYTLKIKLLSDATFGRGDGVPGLVDQEVEHDEFGLPYLRGRTLRGLLAEEMEAIMFALNDASAWQASRDRLLGVEGKLDDETGIMHVGDARLPSNLRHVIATSINTERRNSEPAVTTETVLNALTTIRRQTAMTPEGAPDHATLRFMRVILRNTVFESQLSFDECPQKRDLALLAATVLAFRRAGTGRNRGRGKLTAWLKEEEFTKHHFDVFSELVLKQ